MSYRIAAVEIDEYRRLHHVRIEPEADRALILIGGANANGKTSLLDALTVAFGGKRTLPADPVHHGAEQAKIRVRLADGSEGDIEIRRVIKPDGETVLEVRDQHGPMKSPQAVLDRLIGARFLDPLAFLRLPPKEQRAALMRVIPGAARIEQIDEVRERAFRQRTEVGRDLTKAEGELARLPPARAIPEPIDVAALNEEAARFAALQRTGDGLGNVVHQAEVKLGASRDSRAKCAAQVVALERELAEARAALEGWDRAVAAESGALDEARGKLAGAGAVWKASEPRRVQVDADLKRAGEHNRAVYAAEAEAKRRREVETTVSQLRAQTEELTGKIAAHDRDKAEILAEAMLPVDGLSIGGQGLELGGVPFEQASDAERWRVALAIAAAASPDLDDVWIRDGALLDEQSLAVVERHAEATGRRVWVERVGTRDPGVIEIRDGRVVGGQP